MTTYNNNQNIIDIHNSIVQNLEKREENLPNISKRIDELKKILDTTTHIRVREKIEKELDELRQEYENIKSNNDLYFYLLKSIPLLEEYKAELVKPIEINFMGEKNKINTTKIDKIRTKFIYMIQENHVLNTIAREKILNICPICKNEKENIMHTNIIACSNCGAEKDTLPLIFSYKDTDRINITGKYTYDRRIHFRDCINQFQGKQNSTIKQEVYDVLINQLELHNLVRKGDLPKQIKYEKVTKQHISLFLKETNFTKHYEDVNLIYHNITGQPLDDISHLEEVLMEDFDKLSTLYNEEYIKTRKIERKNFINTQYVLYQLLKRHKYPCSKNDFTFLKTIERKGFHDDICSNLFAKLEWCFICVF